MKTRTLTIVMAAVLAVFCIPSLWSQVMARISGKVTDGGKPLPGLTVELVNPENNRKYSYTTNDKGEFFAIGVATGLYDVNILRNGQLIAKPARFNVTFDKENLLDVDLAKMRAEATQTMSEEEKRKQAEIAKENEKIGNLNSMLAQAQQQLDAGNFDGAVDLLKKVVQVDASKPLIWARLGAAELVSAKKTADRTAAQAKMKDSVESFTKALQGAPAGSGALKPADNAATHANLAEAQARLGQDKDALNTCSQIVPTPEANAGTCYYNVGAVLTNSGKVDDANTAFDKAIAADPKMANAYYWKAVNLMGKATVDKEGKMTAPPEVATNLNKYLELQPNGSNAQPAKDLLASLGAKIETSYGKKGSASPKKK